MGALDIFYVILLAGGAVLGYRKGIIKQTASLLGVAAGIIACRAAGPWAADVATGFIGEDAGNAAVYGITAGTALGYSALFGIVWFVVWQIARCFRKAAHAIKLGGVDRVAGALFLCFKWGLGLSIVLNLWKALVPDSGIFTGGSLLTRFVLEIAPATLGVLRQMMATNGAPDLF